MSGRLRDASDFPPGTRVITPLGERAVVERHQGAESKQDMHERVICRYESKRGQDRGTVALLPHLLTLACDGPQRELF
ncbi:hypothetical protein RBI22_15240 [Alcaligenaceae bacterium C4P045]|nr:hypothetical protein [Alcaligenaceae bacterium C4P045]